MFCFCKELLLSIGNCLAMSSVAPAPTPTLYADYSAIAELAECPRRAYYSQELELVPKEPSIALHAGRVLHAALNEFYASGRDVEAAVEAVHLTWGTVTPPPDRAYLTAGHCEVIMRNYAEDRSKEAFEPLKLPYSDLKHDNIASFSASVDDDGYVVFGETPMAVRLSPHLNYGMLIDLPVSQHGLIYIVDHKTTGQWVGEAWARQYARSMQLKGYARGLELATGLKVAGVYINGIYTGKEAADEKAKWSKRKSRRNALFGPYIFQEHELDGVAPWVREWLKTAGHYRTTGRLKEKLGTGTIASAWPKNDRACDYCPFAKLCWESPVMREATLKRFYEHRPRTGILASGADTDD